MKPEETQPEPTPIMKYLSPEEQKILLMSLRHRAEYWRRMKRLKACGGPRNTRCSSPCAACGFSRLTASVQAAEWPAVSAAALFNEANADQRAGHLGPAILGYERAKGSRRATRRSRRISAPRGKRPASPRRAFPRGNAPRIGPASMAWRSREHLPAPVLLSCSARACFPTTFRGLARVAGSSSARSPSSPRRPSASRWPELDRAVIVGASTRRPHRPGAKCRRTFEFKTGDLVCAGSRHGDFPRIRTSDGRSGWVSSDAVEKIIPSVS